MAASRADAPAAVGAALLAQAERRAPGAGALLRALGFAEDGASLVAALRTDAEAGRGMHPVLSCLMQRCFAPIVASRVGIAELVAAGGGDAGAPRPTPAIHVPEPL